MVVVVGWSKLRYIGGLSDSVDVLLVSWSDDNGCGGGGGGE